MNSTLRSSRARQVVLFFAVTLAVITYIDRVCISQAAPMMQEELGLTKRRNALATQLSGGERQRVALAMVLAQDAPLLLLDEPSNHLDPAHQQALQQQLRHWQQQGPRAALVVLHDLNLALRLASHALLLLPDGQWLAGPVPEVIHAQSLQQCLNQAFAPVQHAGRTWWLAQE